MMLDHNADEPRMSEQELDEADARRMERMGHLADKAVTDKEDQANRILVLQKEVSDLRKEVGDLKALLKKNGITF
jgi:hypothetical protein